MRSLKEIVQAVLAAKGHPVHLLFVVDARHFARCAVCLYYRLHARQVLPTSASGKLTEPSPF